MESLDELKIKMNIAYNYALLNVRFDRIISTMQALNWKWFHTNETPSINEMKIMLDKLYNSAYNEAVITGTQGSFSSGGFTVDVDLKELTVNISFRVEETEGKF